VVRLVCLPGQAANPQCLRGRGRDVVKPELKPIRPQLRPHLRPDGAGGGHDPTRALRAGHIGARQREH
jgi:hypothetical protein